MGIKKEYKDKVYKVIKNVLRDNEQNRLSIDSSAHPANKLLHSFQNNAKKNTPRYCRSYPTFE